MKYDWPRGPKIYEKKCACVKSNILMLLVGEHDAHAFEKYYEIGHSGAALNIQFKNIGEEHGA